MSARGGKARVVQGPPVQPEEIAGKFARVKDHDKVILAWSDDAITVLLFATIMDGSEVPLQLTVHTGPFPDERHLEALAAEWVPPTGSRALTVRSVRGIPVARMLAESKRMVSENAREIELLGFVPAISFTSASGTRFGFSSAGQFANAVEQLRAAIAFAGAVSEGRSDPAVAVAERLCDGDVRKAKNLITGARRAGFLTSGQRASGRVQGALTDEGRQFIELLTNGGSA